METESGSLGDELLNMFCGGCSSAFGGLFGGEKTCVSSRDLLNTDLYNVLSLGVLSTASLVGLQVFRPEREERVFHIFRRRSSIKVLLKEMFEGASVIEHLIMHDLGDTVHRRGRKS